MVVTAVTAPPAVTAWPRAGAPGRSDPRDSAGGGGGGPLQDAERAVDGDLGELPGREGLLVDPVRGLAAVGRVGEHVVDGQRTAEGHPGRPIRVVRLGRGVGVPAVDEQQAQRPTTAMTWASSSAPARVARKRGSVSSRPVRSSTSVVSWYSQPGWFSSD